MLNKFAIKLIQYLLTKDLTVDQRNELVVHIMDSLDALPIYGIITTNEDGELLLGGSSLDIEKLKQLRLAARTALENPALKVINQEVLYQAVTMGVHKVEHPLQMLFARAAIWYGQQQESQLRILGQRTDDLSSL